MRRVLQLKTLLLLPLIAGGVLFLSLYYGRQVDFLRFKSLTHPLDFSMKMKDGKWRGVLLTEGGGRCNAVCRIWTERGSLTRISILGRGLLVLYGSCDITIYPNSKYFWHLKRGRAAFFPLSDRVARSDIATLRPPFSFNLYTHKRSVDQGRTVAFRLTSNERLVRVRASLDRRPIRFFRPERGETNSWQVLQGVDVFHGKGIRRLVCRAVRADGVWMLQGYPFRINRRRYFPTYQRKRIGRKKRRPRSVRSWNRSARVRFWRRWLRKKKYILAENRPWKEWRMLQRIYTSDPSKKRWYGRFSPPIRRYDTISSPFGKVRYLTSGGGNPHRGVDYAAPRGRLVVAPARGRVVFAAKTIVRGGLVILDHGLGVYSTYMHLSRVLVRSNTIAGRGQRLGRVGSTGLSTGPHLHFGIRAGNVQADPSEWMRMPLYPVRRWYRIRYTDDVDDFYEE